MKGIVSNKNKCDLVMLVPHLGDGGAQKVVTTLANAWNGKGKNITVVTIYDHKDEYKLKRGIKRIKLSELEIEGGFLLELISEIISKLILFLMDKTTRLTKILQSSRTHLSNKLLLYMYLCLVFPITFLIFIFNFILVSILSLIELLISLINKIFEFFASTIFYLKHGIINTVSFFLNVLNDFIDDFIYFFTNFKQRFGFGFYGLSFYFITGIFYIKKISRYRYKNYWYRKNIGPYIHIINKARGIRSIIKSEDPRVVLSFIGSTNILTVIACKFLGKKVVISERNDPAVQKLNHPYNDLRPRIYRHASVVTANTNSALEVMKEYVPDNKLLYLPNPLDLSISNNGYRRKQGSKSYILCVGRLHKQKAYDVLLKAFKEISPKLDNWHIIILGKGELKKELHKMAEDLNISDKIEWKGHVSNPYIYYKNADIYVLPSRHEGMSNSLLEAMSFGLPVIVSDACHGSLDIVKHKQTGVVIPVNDHLALASAIEYLANNDSFRKSLGKAGKQTVSQFSIPNVLNIWEEVLGIDH
jgi:glycosyltransferase involved in cell wall biosynthesis